MEQHVDNESLACAPITRALPAPFRNGNDNHNSKSNSNSGSSNRTTNDEPTNAGDQAKRNEQQRASSVSFTAAVQTNQNYVEAMSDFSFTEKQELEAANAWNENPDGTHRIALFAKGAMAPAGAFLSLIRKGKHREPQHEPVRYTGWRFVRGTHGGTYRRDPKGKDVLPPHYDLTPSHEPVRYSESEPDDVGMSADERLANLRRASELAARIGRNV